MPYFSWRGIDIEGRIHKGKLFAQSEQDLDILLFKQEIALLRARQIRKYTFLSTISFDDKIFFFRQISDLLSAGVLLPDALLIVASQSSNQQFQTIIDAIARDVCSGNSLSQILAHYPTVFDTIMIEMVRVGEESSRLSVVMEVLGNYLQMSSDFKRGVRSAMIIPIITLIFFIGVVLLIFILVIPQFSNLFQSAHQELPQITCIMLAMSDFARSEKMIYGIGIFLGGMLFVKKILKTAHGKAMKDRLLISLPVAGTLILESALGNYLQAVSLLIQGGVPLLNALKIAKATVHNSFLNSNLIAIENDVEAGSSLSQAMIYTMVQLFNADTIAIVRVGEETGKLGVLLARAGSAYQASVNRSLATIVTMINPLLMLALGCVVTFLIMAVYIPVFSLSNIAW